MPVAARSSRPGLRDQPGSRLQPRPPERANRPQPDRNEALPCAPREQGQSSRGGWQPGGESPGNPCEEDAAGSFSERTAGVISPATNDSRAVRGEQRFQLWWRKQADPLLEGPSILSMNRLHHKAVIGRDLPGDTHHRRFEPEGFFRTRRPHPIGVEKIDCEPATDLTVWSL